jgi:flavodoxin
MKSLIIYDSNFGNTKLVAEAIGQAIGPTAAVVNTKDVNPEILTGVELLIVGSPINAWKPTDKILNWLTELGAGKLKGIKAASFDTRVRLFIHGNAAKIIAAGLTHAGAELVGQPEGFIVKGKEGPLESGELDRVKVWTNSLLANH